MENQLIDFIECVPKQSHGNQLNSNSKWTTVELKSLSDMILFPIQNFLTIFKSSSSLSSSKFEPSLRCVNKTYVVINAATKNRQLWPSIWKVFFTQTWSIFTTLVLILQLQQKRYKTQAKIATDEDENENEDAEDNDCRERKPYRNLIIIYRNNVLLATVKSLVTFVNTLKRSIVAKMILVVPSMFQLLYCSFYRNQVKPRGTRIHYNWHPLNDSKTRINMMVMFSSC